MEDPFKVWRIINCYRWSRLKRNSSIAAISEHNDRIPECPSLKHVSFLMKSSMRKAFTLSLQAIYVLKNVMNCPSKQKILNTWKFSCEHATDQKGIFTTYAVDGHATLNMTTWDFLCWYTPKRLHPLYLFKFCGIFSDLGKPHQNRNHFITRPMPCYASQL